MAKTPDNHVFISYSRRDDAVMHRMVKHLRKQGIKAWVDNEKLVIGTPVWEEEIENAIKVASAVVVVLSPDSKKSVWVRREVSFAERYKKRIFPIMVAGDEDTSITLRLITNQYVDIRKDETTGLNSLSTDISHYLEDLAHLETESDLPVVTDSYGKKVLSRELINLIESPYPDARKLAPEKLKKLIQSKDDDLAVLAHSALEKLKKDDNQLVSNKAKEILSNPNIPTSNIKVEPLVLEEKVAKYQDEHDETEQEFPDKADLLFSPGQKFDELKQEFLEEADLLSSSPQELDELKQEFLEEASKYKYFDNDFLLSSPPLHRAFYSNRTSWVMASMAKLAYEPFEKDDVELALFISKLDSGAFTLIERFSVMGTQAFLAVNSYYAVLAFRGTESKWQDIQLDINISRKRTEEGWIKSGFYDAYELVASQIKAKLSELGNRPLYITGHSLGGALAVVATQDLEISGYKDYIAACYTFGSPRIGKADFGGNIQSPVYRVVNHLDIVTFLPMSAMGFIHVGDMRYLDKGYPHQIRHRPPLSRWFFFLLSFLTFFVPAISAHGIQNYVYKLEKIALDQNQDIAMEIAMAENQKYEN